MISEDHVTLKTAENTASVTGLNYILTDLHRNGCVKL